MIYHGHGSSRLEAQLVGGQGTGRVGRQLSAAPVLARYYVVKLVLGYVLRSSYEE